MIFSVDVERAFDKKAISLQDKGYQKLLNKETYRNLKVIYNMPQLISLW